MGALRRAASFFGFVARLRARASSGSGSAASAISSARMSLSGVFLARSSPEDGRASSDSMRSRYERAVASLSSRASTSRNASRAPVKSPDSNASRPRFRPSATRLLPSDISLRAFSIRPTASELLMSIRKMRDQISIACWRLPDRAASSPRWSSDSISCCCDGRFGLRRAREHRVGRARKAPRRRAPATRRARGRRGRPGRRGARSTGWGRLRVAPENRSEKSLPDSDSGPGRRIAAHVGRRHDRGLRESSKRVEGEVSEASARCPGDGRRRRRRGTSRRRAGTRRRRDRGPARRRSESPGFVDSPTSAGRSAPGRRGGGRAGPRPGAPDRGSASCRGRRGPRSCRCPSSAAIARCRATSNWGWAFFFWRAFSRICVASWLPGRTWSTCSAVAIAASKSRALKLSAARTSRRSVSAEPTRSCRVGVSATMASSWATSTSLAGFLAFSISCRAGAKRGSIFRMKSHPIRQSSVLPSLYRFSVWRKVERILSRTSRGSEGLPG